jgi:predicted transcriptional regulator
LCPCIGSGEWHGGETADAGELSEVEAPASLAPVLEAIELQRRTIRETAAAAIREVEAQRDRSLRQLDRAAAALIEPGAERVEGPSPTHAQRPRSKRRRRAPSGTSPAATRRRREAVFRYLTEQDGPISGGQICGTLKLSSHEARTALTRLREEGKLTRTGAGRATRYEAKVGKSAAGPRLHTSNSPLGSLQGRLLATILDRGWASREELAQAVGATQEQVRDTCGTLIREEEIHMEPRGGRTVYVARGEA